MLKIIKRSKAKKNEINIKIRKIDINFVYKVKLIFHYFTFLLNCLWIEY